MRTITAMTDEADLSLKHYVKASRKTRLQLAQELAARTGYKGDPAKLKASIDSYLAGNRPSYERAVALVEILDADPDLLRRLGWQSPPAPGGERLEKLQERVDELEARLDDLMAEAALNVARLESAIREVARRSDPPSDGTPQ